MLTGDDSDGDESQDDRLADIKHQHLAPHADASQHVPGDEGSTAAGGAVPSSLTLPQQQTGGPASTSGAIASYHKLW